MPHAHTAPALSLRILVVTCSDTRSLETDTSGGLAVELLTAAGHVVVGRAVVPDEPERIHRVLTVDAAESDAEVVIVNGGTGLSRRDRTFDAVHRLLDKRMDGFGELFRMLSYQDIGPAAMLSRACAGLMGARAVFSVPGSTAAVRLALEKLILPELSHVVREARK
jgi:molybdenum cofactor biosynthesis protein B